MIGACCDIAWRSHLKIMFVVTKQLREAAAAASHQPPPDLAIWWSGWTRRHQAPANWYHQRTRLERDQELTMSPLAG
jgi:hypothetical protein